MLGIRQDSCLLQHHFQDFPREYPAAIAGFFHSGSQTRKCLGKSQESPGKITYRRLVTYLHQFAGFRKNLNRRVSPGNLGSQEPGFEFLLFSTCPKGKALGFPDLPSCPLRGLRHPR